MPSHNALHDSYSSAKQMEAEELDEMEFGGRFGPRVTFRQKAKRHCARWWWLHLIIICGTTLTSSLCLTYVAMPKIAQKGVDDSSLEITGMIFSDPTPSSFVLTQNVTLRSPSIFTPTLDAYNASLFTVDNGTISTASFATFLMPAVHVQHPQGDIAVVNANVTVNDLKQMSIFAGMALGLETVTTAITGKTFLHLGAFPTVDINYFTKTSFRGLDGLKKFNVTNVHMDLAAARGKPNIYGVASIPNPSNMTLYMGEVVMSVAIDNVGIIGNTTISKMIIQPGSNFLPLSGIIDVGAVSQHIDTAGMVNMTITGQSVTYNGQRIPYYEAALSRANFKLPMNIAQILKNPAPV